MTAIAASSVKISTLVDGTLRLVCDVEPAQAQDAFKLFASPGTPMALAALKPATSKPKGPVGPLCLWAVQRCQEEPFRAWLASQSLRESLTEEEAKAVICRACDIESRRELDTNDIAAEKFRRKVMKPYAIHVESQK